MQGPTHFLTKSVPRGRWLPHITRWDAGSAETSDNEGLSIPRPGAARLSYARGDYGVNPDMVAAGVGKNVTARRNDPRNKE